MTPAANTMIPMDKRPIMLTPSPNLPAAPTTVGRAFPARRPYRYFEIALNSLTTVRAGLPRPFTAVSRQ